MPTVGSKMHHFRFFSRDPTFTLSVRSLSSIPARAVYTSAFRRIQSAQLRSGLRFIFFNSHGAKRYFFCCTCSSLQAGAPGSESKHLLGFHSNASGHVPPYFSVETNPLVFMDIVVEGDLLGRVRIELFRDVVPKSAEHFRSLCTGERGECNGGYRSSSSYGDPHHSSRSTAFPESSGSTKSYQGVPFHRIIPGFVVQGGDIITKDGRSNASLFEFNFPSDYEEVKRGAGLRGEDTPSMLIEKSRKHIPGTVALAHTNGNPQENGSQFFFNLSFNSHLDDKFLVIGQVLNGWEAVLGVARSCGSRSGVPVSRSWILACGQTGGYLEEETNAALLQRGDSIKGTKVSHFFPSS